MRMERVLAAIGLVAGLALGGVVAAGDDAVPATKVTPPKAAAPTKAPLSPEDQMMANWQQAATPGPEHKMLENFAGHWISHAKLQMDPSQPAQESDGTADGQLVIGGRFVHVIHKGTMMGQPFEGMMLLGYDNIAKKYVSTWVDNMGTAMVHYDGSFDKRTHRLMMGARFVDPMTLKPARTRSVTTFDSATNMTYEEYSVEPDGKERLVLTITFKKG
jgi:hypothetical protein